MAVVKISELVALTAPAADDIMVVNDVSEAAEADRTKKIRMDDIGIFEASQLASGIVTATKIGTGAVTNTKLGADAVDGTKIANGAVDSEHIAADAVTGAKIADSVVNTEHIAVAAITSSKIDTSAVYSNKTFFLQKASTSLIILAASFNYPTLTGMDGMSVSIIGTGHWRVTCPTTLALNDVYIATCNQVGYATAAYYDTTRCDVHVYDASGNLVNYRWSLIIYLNV